jgi:SAM-dependent methyltransferase
MESKSLNYGRHLLSKWIARVPKCDHALDLGAGPGDDLHIVKNKFPTAQLYGVDSNINFTRELTDAGINSIQLNLERDQLPFDDESIDFIIANQILEHVKEVFWVLHEVSRVLKREGQLFVGVPNLASLHNRLLLLLGLQPTCLRNYSAHVRGFTRHDFTKLINRAWNSGYEMLEFGGSNFYPFPSFIARPASSILPRLSVSIFFLFKKVETYIDAFIRFPHFQTNFFIGNYRSDHRF